MSSREKNPKPVFGARVRRLAQTLSWRIGNSRSFQVKLRNGESASLGWAFSDLVVKSRKKKIRVLATHEARISWARYRFRNRSKDVGWRGLRLPDRKSYRSYLINLANESDRLQKSLQEIVNSGLNPPERVDAVDGWFRYPRLGGEAGRRGCTQSHIEALERHLSRTPDEVALIFEDDIRFSVPGRVSQTLVEFLEDDALDVLCLHGFYSHSIPGSANLSISARISSCAAYAVKPWAIKHLIKAFYRSAKKLDQGFRGPKFGIDVMWQSLQWRTLVFAVPREDIAFQDSGYSQIERRTLKKR